VTAYTFRSLPLTDLTVVQNVCMYQCSPAGGVIGLRGSVQSGSCSRYGDRECFGGTGSGAFAAEQFSFDSGDYSDAVEYVNTMTGGNCESDDYGSGRASSSGQHASRNRARAWSSVGAAIMRAAKDEMCGHRRQMMTGTEAAAAIEAHLNGTKPLNIDMQELNAILVNSEEEDTTTNFSATARRRLTDCPNAYTCEVCTDSATDDNAWFDSDCYWSTTRGSCNRNSDSNTVASSSDCPANCGSASWAASQVRHQLNQKAISWALRTGERAG
jgi:hypothetical protein